MYAPKHFEETDPDVLQHLVRAHPLATLIVTVDDELTINHIPFVLDDEGDSLRLRGHIPRSNPLSKLLSLPQTCAAVFQGPSGYISPAWYATKKQHGKVVPTWNYAVAHCHGEVSAKDDAGWVLSQLNDLTTQQEKNRTEPWAVSDAPDDYINRAVESLVGLEISVARIEGKFKLSQNQPAENKTSLLAKLSAEEQMSELFIMMQEKLT